MDDSLAQTNKDILGFSTSVMGNYFCPRAILRPYLLIAGRISDKKANFKLKIDPCGPDLAREPYVAPSWSTLLKNADILGFYKEVCPWR